MLDGGERPFNGRSEILRICDWTFGKPAHALRELGVVDIGIFDCCSNVRAINSTIVTIPHTLQVHYFLVVSAVVVHHAQQRNPVMGSRP